MPDTRQLIIDAARQVLRDQGYGAISVRKVAAAAGVPLSQIHYHFGSKQKLLLALYEDEDRRRLERQTDLYAGDERLSEQWDRACDYLEVDLAEGYVRVLMEMMAAGWSDPEIAGAVRERTAGWIGVLSDAAARAQESGVRLGDFTADELAALTAAMFIGAEAMILSEDASAADARSALRKLGGVIRAAEGGSA
ncbi:helix-turn-helix domain containing protein [Microbacter sp. GSS18]|nr:helix-turn-helix domain containing protein [Microbacter sp. GSS18]